EQHVLHRHGHAVQETERLALHHRDLRLAREPPRHVVGDETEGVEAGIDGVDAREDGFGELDRRELLAPDQGRALDGRAPDYVVRRHRYHRGIVSSATWPPTRRGCAATPPGVRPASRTATALRSARSNGRRTAVSAAPPCGCPTARGSPSSPAPVRRGRGARPMASRSTAVPSPG